MEDPHQKLDCLLGTHYAVRREISEIVCEKLRLLRFESKEAHGAVSSSRGEALP